MLATRKTGGGLSPYFLVLIRKLRFKNLLAHALLTSLMLADSNMPDRKE